jgi:hypothetical protein
MLTRITEFLALVVVGVLLSTGHVTMAAREAFTLESCIIGCVCVSPEDCPCCGYETLLREG